MNKLAPLTAEFDLRVGGVTFPARLVGSGDPILLAHGIPGDLRTLAPVADRLAATHAALTVSLFPDVALERPNQPFGTETLTNDLAEIVWSLGRGPVHLVAWSYAAHAALALASLYPEFLRSLFVYEPGFPTFVSHAEDIRAVQQDTMTAFRPVGQALEAGDEPEALRHAIDGAGGRSGQFELQSDRIRSIHRENSGQLSFVFRQTQPVPLGAADLGRIVLPVTIARGENTQTCYRIVSDAAASLVPRARHVVVQRAGHLLPEQDPARFAALVREHLEG